MSLDTTQTISRCQWINKEQITALWKLSNPSAAQANNKMSNLQDKFRLEQSKPSKQVDDIPYSKFYVDMDDTEDDVDEEGEELEEDCYSTTWSFSSLEEDDDIEDETKQELHFVKKMDDQNNLVYTTTTSTVKKPISLLTQMLNGSTPPSSFPSQQSQLIDRKPLLKRCQSKYQSLSSWFATATTTTTN
ncbi:hypothetical protein PS15m_010575 [Mucor circinelloides]